MKTIKLSDITVLIKGGGEMASGIAHGLFGCGFRILLTEIAHPTAVRRTVSFSEAVYDGQAEVDGIESTRIENVDEVSRVWEGRRVPILVDPGCRSKDMVRPDVLVDAVLAKKNVGTSAEDAPLVIALGPGYRAGKDAHYVIETNRGHNLGRLLRKGSAESNTSVPGAIEGITNERVLRAPADGLWYSARNIGDPVTRYSLLGTVSGTPVKADIHGVLRGMIRPGIAVRKGAKIGDVDPRGNKEFCFTISEKARSIGGAVLGAILRYYGD